MNGQPTASAQPASSALSPIIQAWHGATPNAANACRKGRALGLSAKLLSAWTTLSKSVD